jgi:hypothetical protein
VWAAVVRTIVQPTCSHDAGAHCRRSLRDSVRLSLCVTREGPQLTARVDTCWGRPSRL